jgi:hypothetical protein
VYYTISLWAYGLFRLDTDTKKPLQRRGSRGDLFDGLDHEEAAREVDAAGN